MLLKICDTFIWLGIFIVLFMAPLMMGSIYTTGFSVILLFTLLTFFIFILRSCLLGKLRFKNTGLEIPLSLLLIYMLCQLILKIGDIDSKFFFGTIYKYATLNEILKLVMYFLFFLLVANTINSEKGLIRILWLAGLTAGLVSICAIVQRLSGKDIFHLAGVEIDRVFLSTFANRNQFAGFAETTFPIILSLLCCKLTSARHAVKSSKRLSNIKFFKQLLENGFVFIFILLSIIFVAVFLSLSRAGMILVVFGILIFYIFYLKDINSHKEKKFLLMFLEVIALFAIIAIMGIGIDPILDRFNDFESVKIRINVDTSTIKLFFNYPLFGVGRGAFRYIFRKFQAVYPQFIFFTHPNNNYLEFLSEAGIFGFLIFVVGIINFLWKNRLLHDISNNEYYFAKFLRHGTLTAIFLMAIHSFAGYDLYVVPNALYLFLVLAIFYSSGNLISQEKSNNYILKINSKKIILFVVMPIYICLFIGIAKIQTNIYLAEKVSKDKSLDEAYRLRVSISRDPLNADYRYKLSLVLFERAQGSDNNKEKLLNEALQEADEACRLAPTNAVYLYNLARILSPTGQWDGAEEFFKKSIKYAPTTYGYRVGYAIFCFNRAYASKNADIRRFYLERGMTQYNVAKEIYPAFNLGQYKENFINFDGQIKKIKDYLK